VKKFILALRKMYEQYWQLKTKPFENTPDPAFVYYSRRHEEAFIRLLYAIKEEKGAAMLSGGYGTGKTLLSRIVIDELIKSETYEVALITHPRLNAVQFLQEFIYQLNNSYVQADKPALLHRLQDIIYQNFRNNKKTVIIIDEAQVIEDKQTFEELRLLLNFQLNNKFLLTMILIGQPELIEKINSIPQFEQRIGIKFHLEALDKNDTIGYVHHRLAIAAKRNSVFAKRKPIFTQEALEQLYKYSGGLPRKINNVCDIALLVGFGRNSKRIDGEIMRCVIGDLTRKADSYAKAV